MTAQGYGASATFDEEYREGHNFTEDDSLYKRDEPLHTDNNQREEMVYISQPRNREGGGVSMGSLDKKYSYHTSSGAGARVYMLDSVSLYMCGLKPMLSILGR